MLVWAQSSRIDWHLIAPGKPLQNGVCGAFNGLILAVIGGLTALFGSLAMLTQPAVKTSLTWSTVPQMGFMIFACGLGLFQLALLHILAHSLYKAHSFLASGDAVLRVAAMRRTGPVALPNARAVGVASLWALGVYRLVGFGFGLTHKSPQAIALSAILIFGVAYMLAQGFADAVSVAVNPFLGQSNETLARAGARLARVAGVSVTMPRFWYVQKISWSEIADAEPYYA